MAFDDDDNPSDARLVSGELGQEVADEAMEDEMPDFQLFASMFHKKGVARSAVRRGEKDFESHGTRAQDNALEASRQVMNEVLSYTRVHKMDSWARGWYFPDWWDRPEEETDALPHSLASEAQLKKAETAEYLFKDQRVVVLEWEKAIQTRSVGRVIPGVKPTEPAAGKHWLLPEEALFLVERGSLDLWWPFKELQQVLPGSKAQTTDESIEIASPENTTGGDEYSVGLPLSLQAAYAQLIGDDGERGKITLAKFQVYSHLRRAGFHVLRAPDGSSTTKEALRQEPSSIWQWLFSLIRSERRPIQHPAHGPLVQPGLYRSYRSIYERLELIPRHKPSSTPQSQPAQAPFTVTFHVWRPDDRFTKARPPPPDFHICVVDSRETPVPTIDQISCLLDSTPYNPPGASMQGPGKLYQRLKHGHRNVLIAVVDVGLVNFIRFGEGAFGEERQWERFDSRGSGTRGNKGGRGRGKGGRGGRGGKRGRGRGSSG
jgi:tRNA-splicing endonuclease subunit Sen54